MYERLTHPQLEHEVCHLVRRGSPDHAKTLWLDLRQSCHFSLIMDLARYSKTWCCAKCNTHWTRHDNFVRHLNTCTGVRREVFKGGNFDPNQNNLFVRLSRLGVDIPKDLRYYPYFAVYDIECLLVPSDKALYEKKHVPVSISVNSNVPNYDTPKCFHLKDPTAVEELVRRFIAYSNEISDAAYTALKSTLAPYVDAIRQRGREARRIELRSSRGDATKGGPHYRTTTLRS